MFVVFAGYAVALFSTLYSGRTLDEFTMIELVSITSCNDVPCGTYILDSTSRVLQVFKPYFQMYGELFLEEMRDETSCLNPEFSACGGDAVSVRVCVHVALCMADILCFVEIFLMMCTCAHVCAGLVLCCAACHLHAACQHPPRQPAHCNDVFHIRGRAGLPMLLHVLACLLITVATVTSQRALGIPERRGLA